jgi:hypothetical protein
MSSPSCGACRIRWVGEVTIVHQEVIVALHPPGLICATHYMIETAIERTLPSHLGADRLRLRVRWGVDWHPDDK